MFAWGRLLIYTEAVLCATKLNQAIVYYTIHSTRVHCSTLCYIALLHYATLYYNVLDNNCTKLYYDALPSTTLYYTIYYTATLYDAKLYFILNCTTIILHHGIM